MSHLDSRRTVGPRNPRITPRRAVGLACAGLIGLGFLGLGLGATCRPAEYQPASMDAGRLREDKAALAELQDTISAGLNAGRDVRVRVTEAQLNRWLAGWSEIWPEAPWSGRAVRHPQVSFRDGSVRVSFTVAEAALTAVVTCGVSLEVSSADLVVRCTEARLGIVPIPPSWIAPLVARLPLTERAGSKWDDGRLVWPNEWIWPNGRRRYRISSCHVAPGQVELVFQPRGPAAR